MDAIEDIVGRKMDAGNAKLRCGFGHLAGAGSVHSKCQVRLILSLIHGGVGGSRHDDIRLRGRNGVDDGVGVCQVELRTANGDDFHAGASLAGLQKACRDLAFASGDYEPHVRIRGFSCA